MGNWSSYSEEWEKQRIRRMIDETEAARIAFERKLRTYKAMVRLLETIKYYWTLLSVHIRMTIDRAYREEIKQGTDGLEEKTIKAIADAVKEDKNS